MRVRVALRLPPERRLGVVGLLLAVVPELLALGVLRLPLWRLLLLLARLLPRLWLLRELLSRGLVAVLLPMRLPILVPLLLTGALSTGGWGGLAVRIRGAGVGGAGVRGASVRGAGIGGAGPRGGTWVRHCWRCPF